jgi:Protein of unknown function (DUF2844)
MRNAWRVLLVVLLVSAPAWAVLGEHQNSVGADRKVMRGTVQSVTRQGYSLHEIKGADGSVVKEYVSPDGVVFGLSWQAPTMPNLRQLLGTYFPDFQSASNRRRQHRGPLVLRSDRLVIQSGGHMRAFFGRAYVPTLLPKGLSAEVVR